MKINNEKRQYQSIIRNENGGGEMSKRRPAGVMWHRKCRRNGSEIISKWRRQLKANGWRGISGGEMKSGSRKPVINRRNEGGSAEMAKKASKNRK